MAPTPIDKEVVFLYRAIESNDHEDQKYLLQNTAWLLTPDPGGRTALTWAAIFGDRLTTRRVIESTPKKGFNIVDKHGCSALHYAVMEGRVDVVKSLLKKGAHANISNKNGMTPLHYASQTLNEFMIKLLLKHKASKLTLDHLQRLPYHVAVQWGCNPNILKILEPLNFEMRKRNFPSPEHIPTAERNTSVQNIDQEDEDHLRKWVLAAKQYAGTIEKARSRDHIVQKVKEEMENYLKIMLGVLELRNQKLHQDTLSDDNISKAPMKAKPLKLITGVMKKCLGACAWEKIKARQEDANELPQHLHKKESAEQPSISIRGSPGGQPWESFPGPSFRRNPLKRPSPSLHLSLGPLVMGSPTNSSPRSLAREPSMRKTARSQVSRSPSRSPTSRSNPISPPSSHSPSPRTTSQNSLRRTSFKFGGQVRFEEDERFIRCLPATGPSSPPNFPPQRLMPKNMGRRSPLGKSPSQTPRGGD